MAASEVRMIFKRCSLITFKRYDQTITMVASGGHVNSLNVGKKLVIWFVSVLIYTRKRENEGKYALLPWEYAKLQKMT